MAAGGAGAESSGPLPVGRDLAAAFLAYIAGFLVVIAALSWLVGVGSGGVSGGVAVFVALLAPLVPFLLALGWSGRLERVSGGPGGIEVLFREARGTIQPVVAPAESIYEVEQPVAERAAVDYSQYVEDFEGRSVLSFRLGMAPGTDDVTGFLTYMDDLEYVTFADGMGEFAGLMRATDFRAAYLTDPHEMISLIDSGEVLERADVVTTTVERDATNLEALETMESADLDVLAVVDDGRFYGVITLAGITREVLVHLFERAEE